MINRVLTTIFGSQHERDVKKLVPLVQAINELEPEIKALSDADLRAKTEEFKRRLEAGETLDDLLVPAFAVAREAAWRTLHMRPFDVQLMGGIILHRGRISEMKTGEGKTLMATLPVYLAHGFGVTTRYGHLSEIGVRSGQRVHRGDLIGRVGSTGRSTGSHLHYEVRLDGTPVNPLAYILDDASGPS